MAITIDQVKGLYNTILDNKKRLSPEALQSLQGLLNMMIDNVVQANEKLHNAEQKAKATVVQVVAKSGKVSAIVEEFKKQGVFLPEMIKNLEQVAVLVDNSSKNTAANNNTLRNDLSIARNEAKQEAETKQEAPTPRAKL